MEDVKLKSEFYSRQAEEIGLIGRAGYIDSGKSIGINGKVEYVVIITSKGCKNGSGA